MAKRITVKEHQRVIDAGAEWRACSDKTRDELNVSKREVYDLKLDKEVLNDKIEKYEKLLSDNYESSRILVGAIEIMRRTKAPKGHDDLSLSVQDREFARLLNAIACDLQDITWKLI